MTLEWKASTTISRRDTDDTKPADHDTTTTRNSDNLARSAPARTRNGCAFFRAERDPRDAGRDDPAADRRTAGGARAAGGHDRDPRHHQPLARRPHPGV